MLRLAPCASRRAAHSRACKSQATATLCGVEVVDATRTTVGSRRLARGGVIRGSLGRWASHERSRDVSANHARAERGGGRPLRGQRLWLHTPPHDSRRVRRYRLRGHRRSRRGFPPACAPRSALEPLRRGNRALGCWSSAWEPRSELWSPASTRSPPPSRRYDARRILPPRDTPHAAPRARRPAPRPPARSVPGPNRPLARGPTRRFFSFRPPARRQTPSHPIRPVPPRPGENPGGPRSRARAPLSSPSERHVFASTAGDAFEGFRASQRSPEKRFPRQATRSLRIWRTISRQIPRRCGQSASPDAGPRAQPGVPPSATWATG